MENKGIKKPAILVIEDNEDIRALVAFRLASSGFEVESATDGESGLAKARQIFPDLIVLDLVVPKLSGEEVCKAIREDKDKKFAGTPILMLTAKTADVDRVIGHVIGANSYITKPFDAILLMKEINKLIEPSYSESGPFGETEPREGVLIVEDDSDTADLLKSRLASVGIRAHVESCGQSALDYAAKHRPDLVLMDLKLPDISGQEVTKKLKQLYDPSTLPVVILTGLDTPTHSFKESGQTVDAYFTKPYDAVELLKTVATILGREDICAKFFL